MSWDNNMMVDKFGKMVDEQKRYGSDLSNIISFDEFDRIIEKNRELLDFLGDSACRSPITNIIDENTYILTADFLIATSKTLESISACCRLGSFADSNMLIRKYKDDIFLYLYIIETSNNRKGLIDKELNEILGEKMTEEKFIEAITLSFSIQSLGIRKDQQDKAIDAWFNNNAESGEFYRLLDIKNYLNYLKRNKLVESCITKHGLENMWKLMSRKQNNYTHSNDRSFLIDNIISFNESEKVEFLLKHVHRDITYITSYFLVVLILIKPDYISSFDYVNFLEVGMTPPEGSQYWVASIVQDYLDEFVVEIHPDLKAYLRDNNPYGMEIE
ncbi:MAG: hypothetical protein WCZ27_00305 [Tissierellaceae bacterium]